MFVYDDPERGKRVLNMAVPVASRGRHRHDNWDTLGMRGTGSNDVDDRERVRSRRAGARRPSVRRARPAAAGDLPASPSRSSSASTSASPRPPATTRSRPCRSRPIRVVQRQVGLMNNRLQVAAWALDGALGVVGDDPTPSHGDGGGRDGRQARDRAGRHRGVRHRARARRRPAFFKGSPLERAYRDIRAIKFHPLSPEGDAAPRRPARARRAVRPGLNGRSPDQLDMVSAARGDAS